MNTQTPNTGTLQVHHKNGRKSNRKGELVTSPGTFKQECNRYTRWAQVGKTSPTWALRNRRLPGVHEEPPRQGRLQERIC